MALKKAYTNTNALLYQNKANCETPGPGRDDKTDSKEKEKNDPSLITKEKEWLLALADDDNSDWNNNLPCEAKMWLGMETAELEGREASDPTKTNQDEYADLEPTEASTPEEEKEWWNDNANKNVTKEK
ncbi:44367_t:CDS:2, partial [Gigaspora margarita]